MSSQGSANINAPEKILVDNITLHFVSWAVDDKQISNNSKLEFKMIKDTSIVAKYQMMSDH